LPDGPGGCQAAREKIFFFSEMQISKTRGEIAEACLIVIASEAKQSTLSFCCAMDCFAEPVIGRAFARLVRSQ
jgi:hypothetical protein